MREEKTGEKSEKTAGERRKEEARNREKRGRQPSGHLGPGPAELLVGSRRGFSEAGTRSPGVGSEESQVTQRRTRLAEKYVNQGSLRPKNGANTPLRTRSNKLLVGKLQRVATSRGRERLEAGVWGMGTSHPHT